MLTTHYDTLKVTRDAEPEVIESAYRALMKKYHPDKTNGDPGGTERAKAINAAYDTLRDPDARARYDSSLGGGDTPREPPAPPRSSQPQREWSATPPPKPTGRGSWIVSLLFIGLALTVGAGAIGSFATMDSPAAVAPDDIPGSAASEPDVDVSPDNALGNARSSGQRAKPAVEASSNEEAAKCSSVGGVIEKVLCEDPALARADARLNEAYAMRLEASSDPDGLRDEQRQWLRKRDALADNRDGLLGLYQDRIAELEAGDLTGVY